MRACADPCRSNAFLHRRSQQQAGPAIWSTEGPACVRPFTVAPTTSHDDGYVFWGKWAWRVRIKPIPRFLPDMHTVMVPPCATREHTHIRSIDHGVTKAPYERRFSPYDFNGGYGEEKWRAGAWTCSSMFVDARL